MRTPNEILPGLEHVGTETISVRITDIPGLEELKYTKAPNVAFLNTSLEAIVVTPITGTPAQLAAAFEHGPDQQLYILDARQSYQDRAIGAYTVRYAITDRHCNLALVHSVGLGQTSIDPDDYTPSREIVFSIVSTPIRDIAACWGLDEAALQLGRQLIRALNGLCEGNA